MLYIRSSLHIIFYFCILVDPRKFYATEGPMERVGDFIIFIFEFSQILKIGSFDFIYFIFNYFYYKNIDLIINSKFINPNKHTAKELHHMDLQETIVLRIQRHRESHLATNYGPEGLQRTTHASSERYQWR